VKTQELGLNQKWAVGNRWDEANTLERVGKDGETPVASSRTD